MDEYKGFTPKAIALKMGASVLIWIFFKVTTAPDYQEMIKFDKLSFIYFIETVFLTFSAWSINEYFFQKLEDKHGKNFLSPGPLGKLFTYSFLAVAPLLIGVTWFMTMYAEKWLDCAELVAPEVQIVSDTFKGLMFNLLILGAFIVNHFWKNKRETELIQEKIIKENLEYKYETLKSHINPHFLFNSFSVLTSLVHQNSDLATDFIAQLSKIYRYVLENKDKNIVPVEDELSFLESYMFLLKIRHDNSIVINQDIRINKGIYGIPALALQMLAENAAKHNSFSGEEPLKIDIYTENDNFLVMRNTLKVRKVENSTGTGLKNINDRYAHLSEKELEVSSEGGYFTVKLPLIKLAS
ncbi:sensor histidine kinase [Hyphobacterium sp. CCMP332]|nr:sensor histidine kinase [Hyphobacterium sp. CCMP332]